MRPLHLTIEGVPVSQKNNKRILRNRRTGKRFIGSSTKVLSWKADAIRQLKRQWRGPKLIGVVHVHLLIFQGKGQSIDADNAMSSAFDAMEKAGVVRNDYQFATGSWERCRDWGRPRIEIQLKPME